MRTPHITFDFLKLSQSLQTPERPQDHCERTYLQHHRTHHGARRKLVSDERLQSPKTDEAYHR
jgi:hypothetical protein